MAELIANAYDADARNVYIIEKNNEIIVEDDENGMSYKNGDITKYLEIARISRSSSEEATTALNRHKMGRKGVGKLVALSVSCASKVDDPEYEPRIIQNPVANILESDKWILSLASYMVIPTE